MPGHALRRTGIGLLALAALLLVYSGTRLTLAGLADYQTRAFLADWEERRTPPSAQAWAVAHAAATRAVTQYPAAHGGYLERLGYIHAWQHHTAPFGATHAAPSRQAALHAYRAATAARPTWPYAWAALADIKLRLLQFDTEFHHALAHAHTLAPWRPNINHRLAELGFAAWPQLDTAQRQATLETARRALPQLNASTTATLFAQAAIAGQQPALCHSLNNAARTRLQRYCAPVRAAPRVTDAPHTPA